LTRIADEQAKISRHSLPITCGTLAAPPGSLSQAPEWLRASEEGKRQGRKDQNQAENGITPASLKGAKTAKLILRDLCVLLLNNS
jgi:hypothetical protein